MFYTARPLGRRWMLRADRRPTTLDPHRAVDPHTMHNFDSALSAAPAWLRQKYGAVCGKNVTRTSWRDRSDTTTISDGAPDCGGGASVLAAPGAPVAASDDEGGDPDPEPEPHRRAHRYTQRTHDPRGARLLPLSRVTADTSLPRSSIYALIQKGAFPPPLKIGRSSRWLADEIDAWLSERVASRDGPAPRTHQPSTTWTTGLAR